MPASDYPQLDGMPAGCTENPPWGVSPIPVVVPYYGVDEFVVMQAPLVNINWPQAQYDMFHGDDVYDLDAPGVGIGYDTQEEHDAWVSFKSQASATKNNTAFYHPAAKEGIVALASRALDLLQEIPAIYDKYELGGTITYPLKGTKERPAIEDAVFPLSRDDDEIAISIDRDKAGIWEAMRNADRERIRSNYHEAIHLLWCALYGKNQSLSYRGNKQIYDEEHPPGEGGGMILQEGPKAPPPTPPGGDFPPFIPGVDPEPPPEPGGITFEPAGPGPDVGPQPPDEEPPTFPGGEPGPQPPTTTKKKRAGGGGAAIVIGLVAVALIAAKK